MKKLWPTLFLLINAVLIFAQQDFQGIIFNKQNGLTIADARIYVEELKLSGVSDKNGCFTFKNLPTGHYFIRISHISIEDTIFQVSFSGQTDPIKFYLTQKIYQLNQINITAAKWLRPNEDIPTRLSVLAEDELIHYPNTNIDNYLQAIPNVYVNRSWGIFSKNSSVTMRGLDGTSRVLVLLDGVPLNLSAGGGINWHMMESGQIEKIEIIKGPASALYGNNAMGGVINLLAKENINSFFTEASLFGGTYNTIGGKIGIGANYVNNNKGFFWTTDGFYRQGDGYIIVPENERDSTDTPLGLKEYNLSFSAGYQFNNNNKINFKFLIYDDKRDEGIKIFEEQGSFIKYTTQHLMGNYSGKAGKFDLSIKSFYHRQDYYQHSERLNQTGDSYKLYDREQISEDYGFWLYFKRLLVKNSELSFGADYKHGSMYAEDIYFTSTDYIERAGDLNFYAIFVQNETQFLNQKGILNLGLRADLATFNNGFLNVEDPTQATGFDVPYKEEFENEKWANLSPKFAFKYKLRPQLHVYTSISAGFMPPKLDDMVSSRKVSKGFKIANPELKPEKLLNYEIGIDYAPDENFNLEVSGYYSSGYDFQYFAHTGDTVDEDLPVVIRDNVSKASVLGTEVSMNWTISKNISFKANYTFNSSKITDFTSKTNNEQDDLTGKNIAETPPHQAYCGIFLKNRIADLSLVANYISSMWSDEFNTEKLDPYFLIDLGLEKQYKSFNFGMDIQNILDIQYIDKKNGLAPGRFIMLEIGYRFSRN